MSLQFDPRVLQALGPQFAAAADLKTVRGYVEASAVPIIRSPWKTATRRWSGWPDTRASWGPTLHGWR